MTIPIGSIILFHGAIASRPTGFNICDGGTYDGYNTPDMRERFVYGANVDEDVDVRGGSSIHLHTNPSTGSSGNHVHGFTIRRSAAIALMVLILLMPTHRFLQPFIPMPLVLIETPYLLEPIHTLLAQLQIVTICRLTSRRIIL